MNEAKFENELIEAVTHGEIGFNPNGVYKSKLWEYADIHTIPELWENFKNILEKNNQDRLDHELSTTEFAQVRRVIEGLTTPYKAGQFLYGMNGVSQIEVDLDDGRHVFLTVFDQDQVGAGNTVYQVVHQVKVEPKIPGKLPRRFDVTFLINGLPIIQVELKEEHHDVYEGLNQMHQYIDEGQYTGIFSTLQILVAMTPYDVRYMANTTSDRFNTDFSFHWQREKDNTIVRNWKEFTDSFLSIPAAHRMSTNYMILDGTENKECIKVMRPYQVYATKKVIDKVKDMDTSTMHMEKLGYIWHTTGSGKTITSFKTAWLLSRLPGVDKVVFLVDRKALTSQTFDNYRAYDPDFTGDENTAKIRDTANTGALKKQLAEKNDNIIITSVQKLDRLVKRDKYKIPDRKFIFIVDEAHRSTGGDGFAAIQKAFKKAAWIGYTGTPKFDKDKVSTYSIFGPCLHAYTIREAIADKNVLGFKVEFNRTIPDNVIHDTLFPQMLRNNHPDWTDEQIEFRVDNPEESDFDDSITPSFYDNNPQHVKAVVADIYKNWDNRSNKGKYNALLTTNIAHGKSVPMAMMYYDEFQRVNEKNAKNGGLQLNVAVTFSMDTSNGDSMLETNKALTRVMDDYYAMFGQRFGLDNVQGYYDNVIARLNRSIDDGKYLDLVIVVDQLLTGFDAPYLNTLYVDRMLNGANLIQAYSRTNRIADMQTKPYGNIVNYRWPQKAEEAMNKALEVYSNAKSADDAEAAYDDDQDLVDIGILAVKFSDLVKTTRDTVEELRVLTEDFDRIPESTERQLDMLKKLKEFNGQVAKLKQYPSDGEDGGYDYNHPEALIEALGMTVEENKILTTSLTNELKRAIAKDRNVQVSDIDLRVEYIKDIVVNYDYLTELLENLMNQVHDNEMSAADETREKIVQFATALSDQGYAKAVIAAADAIFNKLYPEAGSNLKYPYKLEDSHSVVKDAGNASIDRKILDFRNTWGLTDAVSNQEIRNLLSNHKYGVQDLDETGKMTEIVSKGSGVYKEMAANEDVVSLNKIKYRNALRRALLKFADDIVRQ